MSQEETGATEEVEEFMEKDYTKLLAQLKAATDLIDKQVQEIADLKLANSKLRERAESKIKSNLIDDIRKVSNHGIEYLSTCTIDRLEQILDDSKMLKKPKFVSSGDLGGGYHDPYEKLHTMFKFGRRK